MLISLAVVAGTYAGSGQAYDFNGWSAPCSAVSLTLEENQKSMTISHQSFACGAISAHHDSIELEKRGDDFYIGDKKVGSRTDHEIDVVIPSAQLDDVSIVYRLVQHGAELAYKETWLSSQDGSLDETFDMEASLSLALPAIVFAF